MYIVTKDIWIRNRGAIGANVLNRETIRRAHGAKS